jgi:hypothetical protein
MEPKERLQAFLTAMTDWELWCHAELRKVREDSEWKKFSQAEGLKPEDRRECSDRRKQEAHARLVAIFTEFLTQRTLEKMGAFKPDTMNYAKPPRHDQEIEAEYEQKRTQAYLYTQPKPRGIFRVGKLYNLGIGGVDVHSEENLYSRRKYVMKIENGVWRVDAFFDWNPFSNAWSKPKNLSIQAVYPRPASVPEREPRDKAFERKLGWRASMTKHVAELLTHVAGLNRNGANAPPKENTMEPKERLQAFLTAMTEWERWCHIEDRKTGNDYEWEQFSKAEGLKPEDRWEYSKRHDREAQARITAIYTEFLTQSALLKMGASKLYAYSYVKPPEFDQEIEAEYEQKRTHAYVYTQPRVAGTPLTYRRKYDMKMEDGAWKLHDAFKWRQSLNKWERINHL